MSRITHIVLPVCIALAHLSAPAFAQRARATRAPRAIVEDLLKDTTWIDTPAPPIDSVSPDVVAYALDLNRDGLPELEVHAIDHLCHSPSNCPVWIYRRAGAGYERLLDAGNIGRLEAQQSFTHGYRDIMTIRYGGRLSDLTLYKFDGREYRQSACFSERDFFYDRRGVFFELKKPRITRVTCRSDSTD